MLTGTTSRARALERLERVHMVWVKAIAIVIFASLGTMFFHEGYVNECAVRCWPFEESALVTGIGVGFLTAALLVVFGKKLNDKKEPDEDSSDD